MYTVYTKNTQGNTRFSDELISERALLDNGEKPVGVSFAVHRIILISYS